MNQARPRPEAGAATWLAAAAICAAGVLAVAAVWTAVAVMLGRVAGWIAILAAIDAILLLRLAGVPRGPASGFLALFFTVAAIALANWTIPAIQLGGMLGLTLFDSVRLLGWHHAWTLAQLTNTPLDVAAYALACIVALAASGFSGRRRGP